MRPIPDPRQTWTAEDARRVLDEWQRGGGSLAEFSRQHDIDPARLYWWRKRLANDAPKLTALSLVPATVVSSESAAIMIRLPNGIVIESANASPTWLATVVAELTRSSP